MVERDEFTLETGFKDDYIGTVTDAFFATDAQYNNGQTLLLNLKVQPDDGDEEQNPRYPCGPDWGSFDGGDTAEHPKDTAERRKNFNQQTGYGEFINRVLESGAKEEVYRRSRDELGGLGPRNANIWKGLKFHWGVVTEERTIRDRETGENRRVTTVRTFPDHFVGAVVPSVSSPGPGPQPVEVEKTEPLAGEEGPLAGVTAQTVTAITQLAKTNKYPTWVDLVMDMTDATTGQTLAGNANLMVALGDETLYNQLRSVQ